MKSVTRTVSSTSTKTIATSRSSVSTVSSATRRQHRGEFANYYPDLCELQHSHPVHAIKHNLGKGVLDFVADRVKFDEWWSIINALSCDRSLHHVAIRLRHHFKEIVEIADTELKARAVTKQPVLTTRFVLLWLIEAVKVCLAHSTSLTVLELEGIPLYGDYVSSLCNGVLNTTSLQHLSLYQCNVRDDGTEVICMTIKNLPSIVSLDLSFCGLTEYGAEMIAKLILHQKLNRYSEAWKQTLRYRDPDVEAMPGLRRITLNSNPDIGDRGIELLTDEIKDDLWLRALDVQECGLTDEAARSLIELVETNQNLVIIDARGNQFMSEEALSGIMNQLAVNNVGKPETEYKWISKNPDLVKKTARSNAGSRLRPWSSQASVRSWVRAPAPTDCSLSNTTRSLRRSNTTLSPSTTDLWKRNGEKYTEKREDKIADYGRLNTQLREITAILNQVVKDKQILTEENQQLRESLEKCEKEKQQLEDAQKSKVLIDEDTLKTLEDTISRFGTYITQEEEETESEVGSNEDQEIPELITNLKHLLKKTSTPAQGEGNALTFQQKHNKTNAKNSRETNKVYSFGMGDTEKFFAQENNESDEEKQRSTSRLNYQVIWEEDENVSNCGDVPKTDRKESNKSKAQVMFVKMLESKAQEVKYNESGATSQEDSDESDSDFDSKLPQEAEKPLTSSEDDR